MLEGLLQDVRYAARWLRRSPGFTLVAVVSLSIGIGFNTALFSVVDAILFRPLPAESPESLVEIYSSSSDGDQYATSSLPDILDLRAGNDVFTGVIAFSPMIAALNLPDRSRLVLGEVVTGDYFDVLGVSAAIGRTLMPDDDRPGAERVAVISHRVWQRDYGSDPRVIGRQFRLRGRTYTIVGVAPPGFTGMVPVLAPEMWIPVAHVEDVEPAGIQNSVPSPTGTSRLDRRGQRWLFMKARLKPGVSVEAARSNVQVLAARLRAAHPQTNKDVEMSVFPSSAVRLHPSADDAMLTIGVGLMVAFGLVMAVACANVASMLLARAASRGREIAIRLAIGVGRGRLIRQLLVESLLLALTGAAGGVLLAWWATSALTVLDLPIPVPLALDLRLDWRVLVFTLAVSLAAGLLAGLAPAMKSARRALVQDLRGEGGAELVGRRWSLRDGLVAAQMAGTIVLLVVAGLLVRSLGAAQRTDPGFRTDGLAIISADPAMANYDEARSRQFWERALERVRSLPGVQSVALASRLPFSMNFSAATFHIPGHNVPGDRGTTLANAYVSDGYFSTLGVAILEGRAFTTADRPDTPRVAVINEAAARRYWPGESPIGKRIHLRTADGPAFEIVGVSADHRVHTMGEAPTPFVYLATSQRPSSYNVLAARTHGDAQATLTAMRRELLQMEPNLVFLDNQTMKQQVAATLFPARAGAWLVSAVGVVALALAAVGLYGVIAYSVARRTREIGIRMALGARPRDVLRLVMRQGLALAGLGLAAGGVLAFLAARAIDGFLYQVGSTDWVAWSAAVATLLLVATLANLLPAGRAARVDPSRALRTE